MRDHQRVYETVAVTGARGALGRALLPLLEGIDVRPIDRQDGVELEDRSSVARALEGCDAVIHLAGLHPLVAPPNADAGTYERANVVPLRALLDVARSSRVRRIVFASSTSVWKDAPEGTPAVFYESGTAANSDEPYARSKRECEELLGRSDLEFAVVRLARFARPGNNEDEVRKLYRAVDPRDAASAVVLALQRAVSGAVYSVSAPTPFGPEHAADLSKDPRSTIRRIVGRDPGWSPRRIGSVITSERARAELGWRADHPSTLLARN